MAGVRKPGHLGGDGKVDPVVAGTRTGSNASTPGVSGVARTQGRRHSTHKGLHSGATVVLRLGDRGADVRRLQTLLNSRLNLSPALQVDGDYGLKTRRAVGKFQSACDLQVDGVAGKLTWYRLISAPAAGSPSAADVSSWSFLTRLGQVVQKMPAHMPSELWAQLKSLMSTDFLVLAVATFALSQLTGAGELIDLGIILIIGSQVFFELAAAVQITTLATSTADLDEAAGHLAQAIITVGVAVFASKLMKLISAKGGVKTEEINEGSTAVVVPETTRLYRAVDAAERTSINNSGAFTPSPNGSEVKGFFLQRADAQSFAEMITKTTRTPHTVVEAEAPNALVESAVPHRAAGEGPGVWISIQDLWQIVPKN